MTNSELTTERQRERIARLSELYQRRTAAEADIQRRHAALDAQAVQELDARRDTSIVIFQGQHQEQAADYKQALEAMLVKYESEGVQLARTEKVALEAATSDYNQAVEDAQMLFQHRRAQRESSFAENKAKLQSELAQYQKQCTEIAEVTNGLVQRAQEVVARRCEWQEGAGPPPVPRPPVAPAAYCDFAEAELATARLKLHKLQNVWAARVLEEGWLVLIFLFGGAAAAYPFWILLSANGWLWAVGAAVLFAMALALFVHIAAWPLAKWQTLHLLPEFQQAIRQAQSDLQEGLTAAQAHTQRAFAKLQQRRDEDLAAAELHLAKGRTQLTTQWQERQQLTAREFAARRRDLETNMQAQIKAHEERSLQELTRLEEEFGVQMRQMASSCRLKLAQHRDLAEQERTSSAAAWRDGLREFEDDVARMKATCDAACPPWATIAGNEVTSVADVTRATALRIGSYAFDVTASADRSASTVAIEPPPSVYQLPAALAYPECPSLLLEASGSGRDAATQVIQNVMLRLLTTFPPGKVRFTIIDPVGLGQNFSAFMHLADFDERLVTNRIWTEAVHIQQRLTDLTEHMENVIQKYLRNEYNSIQQYNEEAGEVAEPFQILVIANFPANVNEEAARRLLSIASSGARCGVYTLISIDTGLKPPRGFDLADLEKHAATLVWDEDRQHFRSKDSVLAALPLELERAPDDEQFTELVCSVGRRAKDASRVEVPFEIILPPADQWWQADSRGGIDIPLGRSGARKLQHMRLGKGTSQHVLIAGKTGSGKSTLLNALITSLGVHYSPDELQLYLIDFKKGVEFKAYAAWKLPHARVIAIESEREFGMSVLERLDQELKRRGDLFRASGVQGVEAFRNADDKAIMPRVMLIIDEFQEFFTTDDRISHDAALLLDRLVRQGRAFGIHVLLGSQTLAGAYSLARSTLGQMAVRIALQCSESDAHLILSEDNSAARLLQRPGEAIYNDANGMFEGNHPFQVVWLPDAQRESYLRQLAEMADQREVAWERPVIFEGSAPADPAENVQLRKLLEDAGPFERVTEPRAWLGAAVAIKDPTDVVLRRQSGSNLLLIGQNEQQTLGILSNIVISLAAQLRPTSAAGENGTSFYILDGTRSDAPQAAYWRQLVSDLSLPAQVARPREALDVVRRVAEEVDRRLAGAADTPPVVLLVHNLAQFRDLKKSEDFGFSSSFGGEDKIDGAKLLATILREGPSLGVHVVTWCDSFSNLSRWLDRASIRDLELRVLFQMSASDSSNLMDSPAASRLGNNLALFYSEEQGKAEKFRPYDLPARGWLDFVHSRLAAGWHVEEPTLDS
jgi:S-DNA-T family DNA segregation ATPase FtsK/SpoIIIE